MKNNLKHVMLDIETMGNKSNSCVVSIGAVEFDIETGETGMVFDCKISLDSCLKAGLTVDASTIDWWLLNQSEEARVGISYCILDLKTVLECFADWIDRRSFVWGNSARFDCGILSDAYRAVGLETPWIYYNERDVRTLVAFAPEVKNNFKFEGVRHNAVDDCKFQIGYCCEIWKKLKNGK